MTKKRNETKTTCETPALSSLSAEGPGIFDHTTFIHRVNTVGGKSPSVDGTVVGQVARVPTQPITLLPQDRQLIRNELPGRGPAASTGVTTQHLWNHRRTS